MEFNGRSHWLKLVFMADGTVDSYEPQASDSDWGAAKTGTYEVYTGKFVDTGRRYFAVNLEKEDSGFRGRFRGVVITPDGSLRYIDRMPELNDNNMFDIVFAQRRLD